MDDRTDHGHGETAHHASSPLAVWLTHALTGVAIGLIVAIVMAMLHNLMPLPALERAGGDAAQRMLAASATVHPQRPRAVLVGLDRNDVNGFLLKDGAQRLRAALDAILGAGPAYLVIDVELPRTTTAGQQAALLGALGEAAAKFPAVPITLALPVDAAAEGHVIPAPVAASLRALPANVRPSFAIFDTDPDGVVRSVRRVLCRADPEHGWVAVPHIAALFDPARPEARHEGACERAGDTPILFQAGPEALVPGGRADRPLRYVPPGEQPDAAALRGAIVVLGTVGAAAAGERIRTPLGLMEGALVVANAALTLANTPYLDLVGGRWDLPVALLLWVIFGGLVYAVLAASAPAARGPLRRGAMLLAAVAIPAATAGAITLATGHAPDYPALLLKLLTILVAAAIFALHGLSALVGPRRGAAGVAWRFLAFLLAAGASVAAVLATSLLLAEFALPWGWRIGSLLPAFAVMLEVVSDVLRPVSAAIHHMVERHVDRRVRPALAAGLVLVPPALLAMGPARAAGEGGKPLACPGLEAQPWVVAVHATEGSGEPRPDAIRVGRRGYPPAALGACRHVLPGDVLLVGYGAAVGVAQLAAAAQVGTPPVKTEAGPLLLMVQPRPQAQVPGAFQRVGYALGEAVLPPPGLGRLSVQSAASLTK